MLAGGAHRFRDTIASALDWWTMAGVDTPIVEVPNDWLKPPAPVARVRIAVPPARVAAAIVAATPRPADLAGFHALLATGAYLPAAPPPSRRLAPEGDPASPLMIVTDMPDEADLRAGRLLATEAALFDAMLAAMGRTRDTIYLASLSPARITGGRFGDAAIPLAALMRAHLAVVKPAALLVFGDETCRALLACERVEAGPASRNLNHDGGIVAAIATIHPRILRRTPACKAEAWTAMRQMLGVLNR